MVQTGDEAELEISHWDRERFDAELRHGRTNIHPEHWPSDVRMVSLKGLGYLGLDNKGQLYLDGEQVYTVRRWSNVERILAGLGVTAAWVGAIATGISACADWRSVTTEQPSRLIVTLEDQQGHSAARGNALSVAKLNTEKVE